MIAPRKRILNAYGPEGGTEAGASPPAPTPAGSAFGLRSAHLSVTLPSPSAEAKGQVVGVVRWRCPRPRHPTLRSSNCGREAGLGGGSGGFGGGGAPGLLVADHGVEDGEELAHGGGRGSPRLSPSRAPGHWRFGPSRVRPALFRAPARAARATRCAARRAPVRPSVFHRAQRPASGGGGSLRHGCSGSRGNSPAPSSGGGGTVTLSDRRWRVKDHQPNSGAGASSFRRIVLRAVVPATGQWHIVAGMVSRRDGRRGAVTHRANSGRKA
jgi:hypothetical protein